MIDLFEKDDGINMTFDVYISICARKENTYLHQKKLVKSVSFKKGK